MVNANRQKGQKSGTTDVPYDIFWGLVIAVLGYFFAQAYLQ